MVPPNAVIACLIVPRFSMTWNCLHRNSTEANSSVKSCRTMIIPSIFFVLAFNGSDGILILNWFFRRFNLPAQLKIYFKENEFVTSKRIELYGLTYFLASCGGLLSLFIGVTALSFVEIFYYFTLRLVWTFRMYRSKK